MRRLSSFLFLSSALVAGCGTGNSPVSNPNDAALEASSFPAELTCGDRRILSATFRNTGTTTWTSVEGYELTIADEHIALAEEQVIAPGDSITFEIDVTAPASAGVHAREWQMAHEGAAFGSPAEWSVSVDCNRTPDPAEGEALPVPYMFDLIQQVSDEDPTLIAESCQDTGGNWRFMDAVVDRLRKVDTRWGYNWKRGVIGDPSRDVVDYHYGAGSDEGSEQVYIIDMLVDHCGTNPHPGWNDVTQVTLDAGTIGIWTGRERF